MPWEEVAPPVGILCYRNCYECGAGFALYDDVQRGVPLCTDCAAYEEMHGNGGNIRYWTGVAQDERGNMATYTKRTHNDFARLLRVQVEKAREALEENESERRPDSQRWNCDQGKLIALENVARDFAAYFEFDNEAFSREKFLEAAGFPGTQPDRNP